jgi:hypothetical protein
VSAEIDVNAAVKDIVKAMGKVSGSFTVYFQNNSSMTLRFTLLPKKNQFNFKGAKFEVIGNVEKISDNVHELKPGQQGFYAFSTVGLIKAEVHQFIVCNYEAALSDENNEYYKAAPEDEKEYMKSRSPNIDKGLGMAAFGIEIYNETRRDKRTASLIDAYFDIEETENGQGEYIPCDEYMVYSLSKPQNTNLPVDEFKLNTFFKNADHCLLNITFRNNDSSKVNAAVLGFFNDIDRDHSGEITKAEFVNFCKAKSPKADPLKLEEMYKRLDDDESGFITLPEFVDKFEEVNKFISQLELKYEHKTNKLGQFKKGASNLFNAATDF